MTSKTPSNDTVWCMFGLHGTKIKYITIQVTLHIICIVKPKRCTNVSNLFYFWNDTLHVSDGLSVHHQEFKTVHTATDTAVCLLPSRQQYLLLYVQSWTPDDGRRDRPKHVECHSKNRINLIHWCIFLVLLQK